LSGPDGLVERAAAAAQVIVDDVDAPGLDATDSHHLFTVRRLRDGEVVIATDGVGAWRSCVVADRRLEVTGERRVEPAPDPVLEVAFAPVKGDRSEWAVAKLTELGVHRIIALTTDHAAVRWSASGANKALERWRRVAREAACQSRQVHLPEILGPLGLTDLVGPTTALGVPGGAPIGGEITRILIGPEGGFSEAELGFDLARVRLGDGVLRTETAAVAAGVLLGGLRGGTVRSVEER
jgi:16S rRNA (uracil1498-N3)-methyltransferase